MGKGISKAVGAQERDRVSLSELIHQHVRAAIETAVHEELRAAILATPYERTKSGVAIAMASGSGPWPGDTAGA